jgi:hypothetical protein
MGIAINKFIIMRIAINKFMIMITVLTTRAGLRNRGKPL